MSDIDALVETVEYAIDEEEQQIEMQALYALAALARDHDNYAGYGEILESLTQERDRLKAALRVLLEWAEKDRGGFKFADPSEEWYATRDFARAALADVGGTEETSA